VQRTALKKIEIKVYQTYIWFNSNIFIEKYTKLSARIRIVNSNNFLVDLVPIQFFHKIPLSKKLKKEKKKE
jgi:hypothetical protein